MHTFYYGIDQTTKQTLTYIIQKTQHTKRANLEQKKGQANERDFMCKLTIRRKNTEDTRYMKQT